MRIRISAVFCLALALARPAVALDNEPHFTKDINVKVPAIQTDKSVRWDYDIVYVRALRAGDEKHKRFYTDFSQPVTMEPGADLMLLHPDGKEELLVAGGQGSITDPVVSFDGEWVYYSHLYDLQKPNQWSPSPKGADIFKIHVKSRRIVKLTDQTFTPNTGAANWSDDFRTPKEGRTHYDYGVFNMGPCPLPGGRIAFTSNRDGFKPSKGYPAIALQLFVMDDSDEGIGANVEKIGHLNIAGALHPVVLADGRIMFSTLETQGVRGDILWGIWTIHPDGTNWLPLVSAFDPGGAPNGFHFQTQITNGSLVVEEYYNQNNSGFGAYIMMPASHPAGEPAFGPAHMASNPPWRYGRFYNAKAKWYQMPFMPRGSVSMTPFSHGLEGPADESVLSDKHSPAVGKFTHPSGAPDNHMLTVYSPGPVNHQYTHLPQLDGGIYLIKDGAVVEEPAQMLLIKNDPAYNECWPRALVPYERVHGVKEPKRLTPLANDGSLSRHLPAGTPFALVGTASLYKRESYPNGKVPAGKVTAVYAGGNDPWKGLDAFTSHGNGMPLNMHNQGGDVGLYENSDIHAVRILVMEPTTDRHRGAETGKHFYNHANERLRILGEIPVRKFNTAAKETIKDQPRDADGEPDTSFLAKIPADTAFTFQSIDKRGMVLNTSQTWHQLRPGEIRTNCGGCHAHSQKPSDFSLTLSARDDYKVWDLIDSTPVVTTKGAGESKQKWDREDQAGLRMAKGGPVNVEYWRDIRPILDRSCVACHTGDKPAAKLNLDADSESIRHENQGSFPGTYYRLALDEGAKFGHKPVGYDSWGYPNASRYVRKMQSRRSLLTWKVFGERLDGFSNDDHPSEPEPGAGHFVLHGAPVPTDKARAAYDLDFQGKQMPPPDAVAGTWKTPDGRTVKVPALTDEDKFTLVRWIDLGCPIDLDREPARSRGWFLDDNRPVLTVTTPAAGANASVDRILIGAYDYYSGLEDASLTVTATFPVNGLAAGENLASKFKSLTRGVRELKLDTPLKNTSAAGLTVSVKDRQGNISRIDRRFSAGVNASTSAPEAPASRGKATAKETRPATFPHRIWAACDFETQTPDYGWFGPAQTKTIPSYPGNRTALASAPNTGRTRSALKTGMNPVPGPMMGKVNKLYLRYLLRGTTGATFQHFSLTTEDNNHINVSGLTNDKWSELTLNFSRDGLRNDGTPGVPFKEGERMDDFQLYCGEPGSKDCEVFIDDVIFFAEDPTLPPEKEPFPNRVIFLAAFDTGIDPEPRRKYWPGDFDIVTAKSGAPEGSYWGVARGVPRKEGRGKWIRLQITPPKPVGAHTKLRFRYHLTGASDMTVQIFDATDNDNRHLNLTNLTPSAWSTQYLDLTTAKRNDGGTTPFAAGHLVDDLFFFIEPSGTAEPQLYIDEVVLFDAGK
ncbi:MAG TPA: hypothetical protein VG796_13195 [Verrucomicrobiales bacterium]|nr:hypothetical protein [Verrucomicrobiales bacterium]